MVQVNTEEWLAQRQKYIGGSEVAALYNASPYMTHFELWNIKAGKIDAPDLGGERVEAGQFFEAAIAEWAKHKWGMQLRKVHRHTPHPTVEGMAASLDYEAYGDGSYLPTEIKNVDGLVFKESWESEGQTILRVPDHILLQCQQQMACTKAKQCWLIVCVAGNRLYRLLMDRDDKVIAQMEKRVNAFWQSIKDGEAPEPDFTKDGKTISKLALSLTGEALDLTDSNRAPILVEEYAAGALMEKEGKAKKDAAKAEIEHLMGDASSAITTTGKISRFKVKGGPVAYERKPYISTRITPKKQKEEAV